ncbi:MAG: magnesium/cobalt transporter CorA [Bacteroidetes bacterium]|nr:magnesium/cobalt transporter CorA [Bacteroidota bacterium]
MGKNKRKPEFITLQRVEKSGLPPGTLEVVGIQEKEEVIITLIEFNENSFTEKRITSFQDILDCKDNKTVKWINVDGIHNTSVVEQIGKAFNIHPLTLEDIVNTDQRPKFEDYEFYDVAMMKMLYYDTDLHAEQLSIILLDNLVISFQEIHGGDAFDPIRERIKSAKGRIRKCGADYLAYALIDSIVDSYFTILEKIGDKLEALDEEIMTDPKPESLRKLHNMKLEMIFLRKSVWPLRDLINNIERSESKLFKESTSVYLRDVHDHTIRVIETVESYRDLISGMMDIYLSSLSNRMNEVMKVLTIISTIFIPVTFIAGVYGMNFDFMPELHSRWGYAGVWMLMLAIMITLGVYFKRKKWL